MAETQIDAIKGDTLGPILFRLKDEAGNPVDLTGSSLLMAVKASGGTLTFDQGPELVISNAAAGEITFTLDVDQTAKLFEGFQSTFRLSRILGDARHTLVSGAFHVVQGGP